MRDRSDNLQGFIDALEAGIRLQAKHFPAAMPVADRVFSALKEPGDDRKDHKPGRIPVCRYLENALDQADAGPHPIRELAGALAGNEHAFAWRRRANSAQEPGDFHNNHANAIVVGEGGLENRQDMLIGVSLLAPQTDYPRHRHPPEELYIVLSPGNWMQNDDPFAFRQTGDLVHNQSNIWHAMQATAVPLLAIWCLWLGD